MPSLPRPYSFQAPAVRYPLGRSRWLLVCLVLLSFSGLGGWIAGWRSDVFPRIDVVLGGAAMWGLVSIFVLGFWRRLPRGHLVWTGSQWCIGDEAGAAESVVDDRPDVRLDLQVALLLCCRVSTGRPVWLWLESRHSPQHWLALRRALYARASRDVSDSRPVDGSHDA